MFLVQLSISSKCLEVSMAVLAINGLSISVGICQRHHRWLFCKRKRDINVMYIQMSPYIIDLGYISISLLLVSRVHGCTCPSSGLPEMVLFEQIRANMSSFKVSDFTSRPDLLQTQNSGTRYVGILFSLNHNNKTGIYRDWRERFKRGRLKKSFPVLSNVL